MAKRITIGNSVISGYVNLVDKGRIMIGTGSYQDKDGNKVFKESISVFMDQKFDGKVPEKNDYVEVRGDVIVSPRKDKPEDLNVTMNIRFANQLVKKDPPAKKADAPAEAPAGEDI